MKYKFLVLILSSLILGCDQTSDTSNTVNLKDDKAELLGGSSNNTEEIFLSCSLPPLDLKIMNDWSIIAKNDIDDLEDDYRKVFKNIEGTHEGTSVCGGYSWVINYMGTNYQVSEIGCYPGNNYHVPENATAQLTVGGEVVDYGNGPILENGSVFWCY